MVKRVLDNRQDRGKDIKMETYQKILAIEEKLDNGQERDACRKAERTLFDAMYRQFHQVSPADVISSLDGHPVKKEMIDFSDAMEALRIIHEFGEKCGIDIPIIEDRREFLVWLMRDYGLSVLRNT